MLTKLFKKSANEDSQRMETPVPSFIPYACHFNDNTILTKNGELLQTLKIVGFTYETIGGASLGLRDIVRKAVLERIKSSNFALYFHTVRRKHSLDTKPKFPTFFPQKLHENWVEKNHWDKKFINELYVTIIHSGLTLKAQSIDLAHYFNSGSLYKNHNEYIDSAHKELDDTVNDLLDTLSHYGAIRLGLVFNKELGYTSDLLKFFGKIIHLEEDDMPLPMADLSKYLAKYKVAFGNNTLEVRKDESKFFGSILSVKAYQEVTAAALDKFLQLPQQMVITQTVNFVDKKETLEQFKYQNYVLKVSGDEELKEVLGLNLLFDDKKISPVDYCESQITIMLIAKTLTDLEDRVVNAAKALLDIGLPVVREDLNLEHCFWSQLPANFNYIARRGPMPTSNIAGMASLHNFPVGSLTSKWGEAITLLKTALGTPYFFNFHVGDLGHTIIVGNDLSGKVTLLNFLVSESTKLNPNIFYIDARRESEIFVKAMGGRYLVFSTKPQQYAVKLNPLLLADSEENREFLANWLLYLMDKYIDQDQLEEYSAAAAAAVDVIYAVAPEKRRLSNAAEFFALPEFDSINKKIVTKLSKWFGKGKYAHIFDNDSDDLVYRNDILAVDVADLYDTDILLNLPILSYLIHFFKIWYVGTPSILAVAGGNRVFNNVYFELNLAAILDDLSARNSIVVTTGSFSNDTISWSEVVGKVYQDKMVTKIFLPDDTSYDTVKRIFVLSEQEAMYLEALESTKRQFIIRQSDISIVSEMNLKSMDVDLSLLSCNNDAERDKLRGIINTYGDANNTWVKKLYEG